MKKVILIPIIIGSVLLVTGSVLFGVAIANSAKTAKRETKEYVASEAFTNLDLNLSISDLEFKVSEDDSKKLVYDETEVDKYEIGISDNTLKVKFIDERKWYERAFNWNFKPLKMTVYLPAGNYDDLTIKISTGDTKIPSNFSFNNLNYKASTGDLILESNITEYAKVESSTGNNVVKGISPKKMDLEADTGNISLENVHVTNALNIKVDTGKVNLLEVTAENLNVKSDTGKVTLTNTVIEKHIEIITSTGDVRLNDSDAETLYIKTSTGDVSGTLLTSKIFTGTSSTGKRDLPPTTEGGLCEIKTSTGDVNIKIKG